MIQKDDEKKKIKKKIDEQYFLYLLEKIGNFKKLQITKYFVDKITSNPGLEDEGIKSKEIQKYLQKEHNIRYHNFQKLRKELIRDSILIKVKHKNERGEERIKVGYYTLSKENISFFLNIIENIKTLKVLYKEPEKNEYKFEYKIPIFLEKKYYSETALTIFIGLMQKQNYEFFDQGIYSRKKTSRSNDEIISKISLYYKPFAPHAFLLKLYLECVGEDEEFYNYEIRAEFCLTSPEHDFIKHCAKELGDDLNLWCQSICISHCLEAYFCFDHSFPEVD
jgi:hypothetical protein